MVYFLKKNGPTLASVSFIFGLFNKHYKFLQQIYVKKCPSSLRCRDSNPRPSDRESPPQTTRLGLPPKWSILLKNKFSSTHPCTIHPLHQGFGLVHGSNGRPEETVDVDVIHLDVAWRAVGRSPTNQDALVQLTFEGQLTRGRHWWKKRFWNTIDVIVTLRQTAAQPPCG